MAPSPLSMALMEYEWAKASTLVQRQPSLAKTWQQRLGFFEGKTASNVLPLHEASNGLAPCELVKSILDAYPNAVDCRESAYKRLPLHCACRKNANPQVVQLLLEADSSKAALVADKLGRLPIHYALSNGADPQILQLLLKHAPDSSKGVDNRGWTPLHVAVSVGASSEIVAKLVELHPEAVVVRTNRGSSAESLVPPSAPHQSQLKQLLQEARQQFDDNYVDPLVEYERCRRPSFEDMVLV